MILESSLFVKQFPTMIGLQVYEISCIKFQYSRGAVD